MADLQVASELDLGRSYLSPERGLWSDAFRALRRNRLALLALVLLSGITVLAIGGNYLEVVQRHEPETQEHSATRQGPSFDHPFGTDNLGRDSWSRVLQGLLISLQVGFGVQLFVVVIGVVIGGTAALGGRLLDNLMMRVTDVAFAFPDLLAIILIRSALQSRDLPLADGRTQDVLLMIFAIGFVSWVTIARLVRGQMLSLAGKDFVIAARAMGVPAWQIVFKHMLPNTLGPVIVVIVFGIPLAIFSEATLGFIGIGLQPPTASLGVLTSDGYRYISSDFWLVVFPSATLALLMMCFTFLGDGLRDALDPRAR